MLMLVLQSGLLIAVAFLIGCLLFAVLRGVISPTETATAGAAIPTAVAEPARTRSRPSQPYLWSGRIESRKIVLSGSAPSAKARAELVALATTTNPGLKIDDRMVLLNGAPDGWRAAAANGVKALAGLSEGRVRLNDLRLTIEGRAASDEHYARLTRDAAASAETGPPIDASHLQPPLSAPAATEPVVSEPVVLEPAIPEPTPAVAQTVAPVAIPAALAALPDGATSEQRADAVGTRPSGLPAPRGGKADDLKRVRGIGPKNEKILNGLGVYHFDQIAAWTDDVVRWVDSYISFPGRIDREEWISQCALLARGGETEHSRQVDRGEAT